MRLASTERQATWALGRRLAVYGVLFAFVAGFQLLPIAHFALCKHDLTLDGEVVHTEGGCHSDSHVPDGNAKTASTPALPSGLPSDSGETGVDHCIVFQALQQSVEELLPHAFLFTASLSVAQSPEMRSQEVPAGFKRYLLAPATSPPIVI